MHCTVTILFEDNFHVNYKIEVIQLFHVIKQLSRQLQNQINPVISRYQSVHCHNKSSNVR